ncbi:MAG: hypothetical protein ABI791_00760 [Acidobacteriota bacterium]
MSTPKKILLQTTIPFTEDDWHIGRFTYLHKYLASQRDASGERLYIVAARDREVDDNGDDPVILGLPSSDLDELWLFAVDTGDGLSPNDCSAITKFRQRGGGILSTRDHFDLGSSLCTLGGIGAAHYFHSKNQDPDPERNRRDDTVAVNIDFPNYHSGLNGDYQKITVPEPHELLMRKDGSLIEYFPSHPHEGGIGAPPDDPSAKVVATGKSQTTGRPFNLVVAFERSDDEHGNHLGRAIAESSFHHLVDYNWDVDSGAPSFLEEPPGDGYKKNPNSIDDIHQYVANAAKWLART